MYIVAKPNKRRKQKLVNGIGINDADYAVTGKHEGKQFMCPFYAIWKGMLTRCYYEKALIKDPSYRGCTVAEEWHLFSAFRAWMAEQCWQGNQLDKDFLATTKIYSPATCLFLPNWLNALFQRDANKKSGLPPGVDRRTGRYKTQLYRSRLSAAGKATELGCFATPEAAHAAYVAAKTDYVRSRYPEIALIDPRLVEACERRLKEYTEYITPSLDCANTLPPPPGSASADRASGSQRLLTATYTQKVMET
jgi:hypothetical protein